MVGCSIHSFTVIIPLLVVVLNTILALMNLFVKTFSPENIQEFHVEERDTFREHES